LKFKFKSHDPSKYNCVIDYQKPVINYQWKFLEKAFWKDTSIQTILKRHEGPIYMCVWLQKARERYFKRTSLSNVLSITLGQTLANLLRVHLGTSNCIIHSKGEKFFCSSQKVNCNQETGCLLNCEFHEHKGKRFLGCSEVVKKIFTKIVKNLKWVAWGLDVGTRRGRTSINQVCISLFPYLIYVIAINFSLHV